MLEAQPAPRLADCSVEPLVTRPEDLLGRDCSAVCEQQDLADLAWRQGYTLFAGQTGACEPGGIEGRSQCAGVRENLGA